ncbi:unnamed protein product, partial [Discosporangium mesarthrocarpum]
EEWGALAEAYGRGHQWAVRTECLLSSGCDDRLVIPYSTGKKANKYHCSPVPTPEVVSRSSCTSSSSSRCAFGDADNMRSDMLLRWALENDGRPRKATRGGGAREGEVEHDGFGERMEGIHRRLKQVLGLEGGSAKIFLTPSGSDAELLPTVLARMRAIKL